MTLTDAIFVRRSVTTSDPDDDTTSATISGGPLHRRGHNEGEDSEGVNVDGRGKLLALVGVDGSVLRGEIPVVDLIPEKKSVAKQKIGYLLQFENWIAREVSERVIEVEVKGFFP